MHGIMRRNHVKNMQGTMERICGEEAVIRTLEGTGIDKFKDLLSRFLQVSLNAQP